MATYERHRPENSVLYQTIARSWPRVSRDYGVAGEPILPHVETEFDRYLKCGILENGFVRLVCKSCDAEKIVGFSCKQRGFCPSCGSRRREQKADRLESEVWPNASARQWVLTFPHQVRHWLASSPKLFAEVIRVVTGEISFFYEQSSVPFSKRDDVWCPTAGAVSFVQLFGSSLALNPHLHMIFADGAWGSAKGGPTFFPLNGFTTESMFDVLAGIHGRLDKLFRRRGYVQDDGEAEEPEIGEDVPIPFRPRAPKAFRRKGRLAANPRFQQSDPDRISVEGWANIRYKWFSLHAGVVIKGEDRVGLKRLFRYAARPSVTLSMLSYVTPEDPDRSDVELALKRVWSDGSKSLIFKQTDFVERLASIVPPPWFNQTRYSGVFAPAHAWRDFIVPGPERINIWPSADDPGDSSPPPTGKPSSGRAPAEYYIPWAELLRRTMGIDPEICQCGARMVVDDVITDIETITATMTRMGLSSAGPPKVSRSTGELDCIYDI